MQRKALLVSVILALVVGTADAATPIPEASYLVGFSPRAGAQDVVLQAIQSAKSQILVAAYSFTSKPVAMALLSAANRGVQVAVVADAKANDPNSRTGRRYSAAQFLANKNVAVRLNSQYAILHDKFMVIDGRSVQMGSFNYSAAAHSQNAENVLLLRDVPQLARQYAEEWRVLWEGGVDLPAKY